MEDDRAMRVQVVYFDGCPSWQVAAERLQAGLERTGHGDVRVELVQVRSPAEAVAARFAGSPTLLVDGRDLFPGTAPTAQLACRVYPTPQGLGGSPSLEALVTALSDLAPADPDGPTMDPPSGRAPVAGGPQV
jgi:hypothetical protein